MHDYFRMQERPEVSLEDQLQIANFLIVGLQQQVARYEFTFTQFEQRAQASQEIMRLQKQSIEFLEGMLNRVEMVFKVQIDKQKDVIERLKKELNEAKAKATEWEKILKNPLSLLYWLF